MITLERALLYHLLLREADKPEEVTRIVRHIIQQDATRSHNDLLDVTETQHHLHAFGEIYTYDNAVATDLALQDTWYQITIFTANGTIHEMIPDFANNRIEVVHTGNYLCTCSISSYSAQANNYIFALFKNGTELENMESARTTSVANQLVGGTITGLAALTAGDYVTLWVKRLDGGAILKSVTCSLVNFSLVRLL